ncbi:colanic acid exporter [compost metagenome]
MNQVSQNILLNVIALGLAGACALAFNIQVTILYGAETFGVLSQVYALLIVLGQLGTLGVQFSVQRFVATTDDSGETLEIINSAFTLTTVVSFIVAMIFYFSAPLIASIQGSPDLEEGVKYAAVGLFFFCLNKVVLGSLNGKLMMRWFAFVQLLRSILLLAIAYLLFVFVWPGKMLSVVFTVVELVVFVCGATVLNRKGFFSALSFQSKWVKQHFVFGYQSVLSGLLIEFNTRIDVLMIGYFLSDRTVGIYALAATFAEGFSLILNVLRSNFNPPMARFLAKQDYGGLRAFISSYRRNMFFAVLALGMISIGVYKLLEIYQGSKEWSESFPYYLILLIGMVGTAAYFPFLAVLMQAGRPTWFSVSILVGVVINCALNIILIPLLGGQGAAWATSGAMVISTVFTVWITNYKMSVKIL